MATGSTLGLTLSQRELSALLRVPSLAVLDDQINTANFNWVFDSGRNSFDYLAVGETLTLTYTVKATDDRYAESSETITIVINGSNDAITLNPIDQIRNHTQGEVDIKLGGMVKDSDLNDAVTFLIWS